MTDPIADMLTRIRNAAKIRKAEVFIPFSKMKLEIAKILKREGFISDFEEIKKDDEHKFGGLNLVLKYEDGVSVITGIKKISKPGRRVYAVKEKLPIVVNDYGIAIISTSAGIMTNRQAKKAGLGGEVICEIY
ncbi:MAG: 30S ribosomal protein S8 [Parcubacteria group bacterium ADurb.Bin326]|jgi:small subunit ribosomal protein S8|nr:MAG: 30S ribosomal protein S8 [Parcubacteria group bacterium ADurb.Bin326]